MLQPYNPKNANVIVNINGRLVRRSEASVSPFDSAVQNGDAVWEGVRLYNGRIFRLRQHLLRLRKSAEMLKYEDYPQDDYIHRSASAHAECESNDRRRAYPPHHFARRKYTSGLDPRINTAGCTLIILPEFKPPVYDPDGITLVTATVRRPLANVLISTSIRATR